MVRVRLAQWVRRQFQQGRYRRRHAARPMPRWGVSAEALEDRLLLFAPIAMGDSYSVVHDQTLSPGGSGVLSNDIPMGGGTLTAVLVSSPTHASSFTLNSNGTFSYTPSTYYAGSDSFSYKAFNGTEYSSVATASITVSNFAPTAVNDSYTIYKDTFNSASEGAATLLANDFDSNGDTLTTSLVSGPSHGSVTVNSNGTFVYTPTTGYFGSDSFVYAASDGVTTTNATASLTVTNPFSAQTNAPDTPFIGYNSQGAFSTSQLTGEARTDYPLPGAHALAYGSLSADVKPIIAVETTYGGTGITAPDSIEVQLTYGGISATPLYFNHNALTMTPTVRFAFQVDASSLPTGHYQYSMTVISHYGSNTATRVFTGYQDIVNRQGSEFGPGWSVKEVDRLAIGTGGVLWTGGEIGTAWYTDTGSGTYSSPAGPMAFHTLVKNVDNTYTLTDKYGNKENFSTTGLLTSRVDRNGNTTSYAYNGSSQLTTITDPFSRVTTFNYTSGKVTSITDIASRTTTLAYTSGKLTSITAPDPDGGGALSAPAMTYGYDSSNRLTSVTDPLSHATTLTYNFAGRLSQATFANSSTTQLTAAEMAGLINPASGTGTISNPADPYLPQYVFGFFTNELSLQLSSVSDRFGNLLSSTDPLGLTTTWQRNANGQVTQMTTEDPDGVGGQSAEVTSYQYDSKGNLTRITYPDSSYETWTYHSTLNQPLTHTDRLSHTTTYTYDAYGNPLTVTDPLSNVTTSTYTSRGLISTVTGADPDGAGSLTSPVTSYTYDSYGRVTQITNPDTTHRDFTYDTSDNKLTDTDELSRVTTYAYDNLNRLTSITGADPDGAGSLSSPVTTYAYDAANRKTSETDPLGKVTSFGYDVRDRLTTVTTPDPDGAGSLSASVTTYGYNSAGWRTTITDALGKVTTYGYDNDGRVTSITQPDPDGAGSLSAPVTSFTYDNIGRKTRVTDPRSNYVSYAYNSLNQITSETDQLGKVTSYTYNALGQVLTKTLPDPDGAGSLTAPVTTYTYNSNNQLLTTTDALGYVTTNAYDNLGRLKTVTQPDPDGAGSLTSPVTTYTYDSRSRQTKVTNALGYDTQYAYDNASQLTSVTTPDPDGAGSLSASVTSYAYDNLGRLITVTDPLSHTHTYTYDAKGQKLTETDGLGNVTTYAYDYAGRLTTVTGADPDGAGGLLSPVTTYAYDANNRTTSVTAPDPDGAGGLSSPVTSYTYDYIGRVITVTDPLSHSTSYEYDANGNRTKVTDPLGKFTTYAYDAANRLTSVTEPDPDGAGSLTSSVTTTGYDYIGRKITVTDPRSGVTRYGYDANGNLTSIQDPGNNTTTYTLDRLGRLITETNANSASRSFSWDAIGELTSKTDRNSRVTNYTYDRAGRLTQEDWMSGGSSIRTLTYVYDAANRLTSASDPDSAYAYSYNAGDELTQVDNNGTPNVPRVILTMGYDSLHRRTSLSASVAGTADFADAFSYDALDRMTQITQQGQAGGNTVGAKRIDLSYNAAGNFAGVSRYANLAGTQLVASTTYGYDNDNRLTSLSHDNGGTNLASYTWSFDYAGRLTGTTNADGSTSYTYDAAGELTAADHSYQTDEAFSYDANGNRTNSGYSTGTNNRMTSDGTYNYTYDSEGNRTRKTTISSGAYVDYVWDYHNRLTDVKSYTSGGTLTQRVHYTYDVFNRLSGKQLDSNGDGTYDSTQRFVSYGDETIFVFDGNGSMTNRYLSGPVIDQVFADERANGTIYWSLADNQGTVRDVAQFNSGTNTTTVVNHLKYDSFGNITAQSDSTKQPLFAYTGRQWDSDANLQYNRARWYEPRTGRFLSEDPSGFEGGDVNLNRYVANSPVRYTDPTGLMRFDDASVPDAPPTASGPGGVDLGEIAGGVLGGLGDGATMLGNAMTLGLVNYLSDGYVDKIIRDNGGVYEYANWGARTAAGAIYLATGLYYWQAVAGATTKVAVFNAAMAAQGTVGQVAVGSVTVALATFVNGGTVVEGMVAGASYAAGEAFPFIVVGGLMKGAMFVRPSGCFVAGTHVLTCGHTDPEEQSTEPGDSGESDWYFAAATIAGALAVYEARPKRRRVRRRERLTVEQEFERLLGDDEGEFDSGCNLALVENPLLASIGKTCPNSQMNSSEELVLPAADGHEDSTKPNNSMKPASARERNDRRSDQALPEDETSTKRSKWKIVCSLLAVALFTTLGFVTRPPVDRAVVQAAAIAAISMGDSLAIEMLRVGDRVVTRAEETTTSPTEVDQATWRHLRLRGESRWDDGTLDVIEVETLQPPEWVAAHGARVGATVPIPLDLEEMGIDPDLSATVIANDPCPTIQQGQGRVVLTTVSHLNPDVRALVVRDAHGQRQTIQATGQHKFYSETRDGWIAASDLLPEERLVGISGPVTVVSVGAVPGVHRVYNLTAEGEHVYRVSPLGVLVHNNSAARSATPAKVPTIGRLEDTRVLKNDPGHLILDTPKWNQAKQDAFTEGVRKMGKPIYIASPITPENQAHPETGDPTVFWLEYQKYLRLGYERKGDYLVPPHR